MPENSNIIDYKDVLVQTYLEVHMVTGEGPIKKLKLLEDWLIVESKTDADVFDECTQRLAKALSEE